MAQSQEITKDEDYKKQLTGALEIAKSEYQNEISRFRGLDNKLNMLLALAIGILAALGIVVTSFYDTATIGVKILSGFTLLAVLASVGVIIFMGLLPHKYRAPDISSLANGTFYPSENAFLLTFIKAYQNCLSEVFAKNKSKTKCMKIAVAILGLSLILLALTICIWLWR